MKDGAPTLLPLLRSRAQGDIIAWIMLHPEAEASLTEIADHVGVSAPTVMREVNRLVDAGLVRQRQRGNTRLVQAATDNPAYRPLAELMAVTFGPVPVLTELLSGVVGVQEAFIYGSWAARYHQQPGPVPADIDVLVIGSAKPDDLEDVAAAATTRLGREVNIRRIRSSTWHNETDDPFRTTVLSRPIVPLIPAQRSAVASPEGK